MKKFHFIILLFVTTILGESCRKHDESDNYVRGMLDGQAFTATSNISANKPEPIPGTGDDPTLRITAQWPSYSIKLMLLHEDKLKKGLYVLSQGLQRSATLIHNNTGTFYVGSPGWFSPDPFIGSGSITIIDNSKKYVKGNFEFTGVNSSQGGSKTITNGEFSIARN